MLFLIRVWLIMCSVVCLGLLVGLIEIWICVVGLYVIDSLMVLVVRKVIVIVMFWFIR